MGKKWDYDVPGVEVWQECLRVLKPGGTALIFAGSRTQHRMAVAVEDAGFILKDCIMWLYGSGFPKAYDIAKGIEGKKTFGSANWKDWNKLDGDLVDSKIGYSKLQNKQGYRGKDYSDKKHNENVKLHHPEAKLWNGWKSHGLKPAYEPILVAMKPNEGTYANNALKHGVSGLNIDGGRIGTEEKLGRPIGIGTKDEKIYGKYKAPKGTRYGDEQTGRFPANIILDEEAGRLLDLQSGELKSGDIKPYKIQNEGVTGWMKDKVHTNSFKGDSGGASRFFYCAKASKSERNAGCEGLEEKEAPMSGRSKPAEGRTSALGQPRANHHPTVKPLKLMEYLCTLTKTPTGGIVLDPFAGSGTTGVACQNTGRDFILIEREEEYIEIIKARLNRKIQEKLL